MSSETPDYEQSQVFRTLAAQELAEIYKAIHYGTGHMGLNAFQGLAKRRDEILRTVFGVENP